MSCSKLLSTRPYDRSIFCDKPNIENSNMRLLYSVIYEHLLFFGSGTLCGFNTYVGADDMGFVPGGVGTQRACFVGISV